MEPQQQAHRLRGEPTRSPQVDDERRRTVLQQVVHASAVLGRGTAVVQPSERQTGVPLDGVVADG